MNVDESRGVCKDRSRWRSVVSAYPYFFWVSGENHQYDEFRSRWKHERKTMSDFYWLKIPPAPAIALGARCTVSRLNGSRGSGRQLA